MDVRHLIKNLKYKKPCYVSLSITERSINAVFMGVTQQRYELLDVYRSSLPEGAIKGTQIHNYNAVLSALQEIKKNIRQCPSLSAISLWGNSFIYKFLRYEGQVSDAGLASKIETEITNNIPYAIENMMWDYEKITSGKKSVNDTHILLTIAHKPEIEEWTFLLADVGLKPVLVDTEATSLLNYLMCFSGKYLGKATACFHLAGEHATFVAVDSLDEFYIREHDFGTVQLRSDSHLSTISNYSSEDVLPEKISELVAHDSHVIAHQVSHAVGLCATEIQWTSDFVVYLSGTSALLSPVIPLLAKQNITCQLAIPESHLFKNDTNIALEDFGISLATSMGLASRGLNQCHL